MRLETLVADTEKIGKEIMLQRKAIEKRVFTLIEFVETVIIQYFSILFGTLTKPQETIQKIQFSEKISPLLFFIINVVIAALIEGATDSNSLLEVLLKSVVLTKEPKWDDKLWSILGLFLGSFLLVLIIRAVSYMVTGRKVVVNMATKSLCYASFTFVPIVIAKFVLSVAFFAGFYEIYGSLKHNPILSALIAVALALSFYIWWSIILLSWLKSYLHDSSKLIRVLVFSLIAFFLLKGFAYNFDSLEKIQTISKLTGSDRYVTKSLEKSPPDYTSAAAARMLISDTEELSPYRRYCEKIKAITYFANGIPIFDFDNALIALKQSKYELLDKYFSDTISKANKSALSISQQRQLGFMNKLLGDAKKEKSKEGFNASKYETSIAFMKFPFYDTSNKYLRLLP